MYIFISLYVLARVCYNPVYCLLSGVEGVVVDMAKNEVTIKGIVEPQAVCSKIMKKTKRRARVLSPLPSSEGEAIPEVVTSQVSYVPLLKIHQRKNSLLNFPQHIEVICFAPGYWINDSGTQC